MKTLIYLFLALAVVGSLAMLSIDVAALLGFTFGSGLLIHFLVPGLFVVWIPTIFVMNALTKDFKQKEIWRAALRGCPPWMRRTLWIIFGYACVGFFALPFLYGGGMDSAANKSRSMSAVLLSFYMISAAVFYSATRLKRFDDSRHCLNGHHMSPLAKFCEECGAPAASSLHSQE